MSVDEAQVQRWLAEVESAWARGGVSRRDQRRLGAELQSDIEQEIASGAPAQEILDPDPVAFALNMATAHGLLVSVPAPSSARVLAWRATLGAVAGFAFGWFFAWPVLGLFLPSAGDAAAIVIAYTALAASTIAGAGVAIQAAPGARLSNYEVYTSIAGLVVGALVAAPVAVAIAVLTNYESSALVVVAETITVGSGAWVGFLCATRLTTRRRRRAGVPG